MISKKIKSVLLFIVFAISLYFIIFNRTGSTFASSSSSDLPSVTLFANYLLTSTSPLSNAQQWSITFLGKNVGYLTSNLFFKMKTISRMKEIEKTTDTENNFEEDFLANVPDSTDFIDSIEYEQNLQKIREYIDKLPEKEKEAVKKMAEDNEKLNNTERKAKNRGLNKIRENMKTF